MVGQFVVAGDHLFMQFERRIRAGAGHSSEQVAYLDLIIIHDSISAESSGIDIDNTLDDAAGS